MSNKQKTPRSLSVVWPKSVYFTFKNLVSENPEFASDVTLYVRLKKAVENKIVAPIGTLKAAKGRPELVYSLTPVVQSTIDAAKSAGVDVVQDTELVNVLKITSDTTVSASPKVVVTPTVTSV